MTDKIWCFRQLCEIKYESFGYTSDQMQIRWMDTNVINPNITLDQFSQTVIFESNYATDYYESSFPGVILRILLERKVLTTRGQQYLVLVLRH